MVLFPSLIKISVCQAQEDLSDPVKKNLDHLEEVKYRVDSAEQAGNTVLQVKWREHLIHDMMIFFNDNAGAYEEALKLEAFVESYPEIKNEPFEARRNMVLGMLLRNQGQYEESLRYFENAVERSRDDQNTGVFRDAIGHVGEIYSKMNESLKAMRHWREAVKEIEQLSWNDLDKQELITRQYVLVGEHFLRIALIDSALFFARKSIYENGFPSILARKYLLISEIFLKDDQHLDSVIWYGKQALDICLENGFRREEILAYEFLYKGYEKLGYSDSTLSYFKRYYDLEQDQRSYQDALRIGNLNIQRERERAQLQQTFADQQISNQRLVIWIVSGGGILLVIGLIYIFNQLKLIRKQNKIIEQEKLRAEHSEKAKEQFLANMSHEIRTPMNAISGMINSLQRRDHTQEQKVYLESMKISTRNLLVILNDILDMSKLTYGNLDITKVPINLTEVCAQVVNLLKQKADEKGVGLAFKESKEFPKFIMGDPVRMNQILVNLVGNAIKFTDEGDVSIRLQKSDSTFIVEVSDTGIGISAENLPNIFEQFRQGEGSLDKRYAGTGLGLAISKQLVELQDGRIWVESKPGKGSTFSFELPLDIAHQPEESNQYSEVELKEMGSALGEITILIAEDNPLNRMVIEDDLNWFFPQSRLTFVENGKQVLEALHQHRFDLILMDVQMPEMNGYDASMKIRKIESERKTPIIALTASLLKDQIDKCFETGMDGYIPKPYSPQDLVVTIVETISE